MKDVFSKILPAQRQQLWIALALTFAAGLFAFLWDQKSSPEQAAKPASVEEAATYIPAGFVLVPIEVANFESLDSILGNFGVVDLFAGSDDPRTKPHKVASQVKILRAPLNPNHFAVLIPDSESQKIVAYTGPLTVVVKNPKTFGTTLVNPDSQAPRAKRISRVIVEVPSVE